MIPRSTDFSRNCTPGELIDPARGRNSVQGCCYGQCGGGCVWQTERVMVIPAGQLQNLETRTVWPFRDVDGKSVW